MQSGILSGGVMPTRQLRKVLDGDSGVWDMAACRGRDHEFGRPRGAVLATCPSSLAGLPWELLNINGI